MVARETSPGFWGLLESRYRPFRGPNPVEPHTATRIAVLAGLGAALNIAGVASLQVAFDEPIAALIGFGFAFIYVAATAYFVLTGDVETQTWVILLASLVGNVAVHVVLGGYLGSGGFLFFGVLVSAVAALLLGKRATVGITSAYVLVAVALLLMETTIRSWRDSPEPALSLIMAADVFVVVLLILVPMTYILTVRTAEARQRAHALLLNVFPEPIATRLEAEPGVIAEEHRESSVLFADLVGFTAHASAVDPEVLVAELNHVFSRFDDVVTGCGAEKIKTIGDGYLAIAGAPRPDANHSETICDLALQMQEAIVSVNEQIGTSFELRIGINSGRVVAGVIGSSRFSYDIWGDTVNLASRLESAGEPGDILASRQLVERAPQHFRFEPIGSVSLKGIGMTEAFRLLRATPSS